MSCGSCPGSQAWLFAVLGSEAMILNVCVCAVVFLFTSVSVGVLAL